VLRMHMLRKDGSVRDTVVYSMLREDWCKNREIQTPDAAGIYRK
ncbi:N-acetyltransferase, partial [Neisseria meningitidis]|nr:N-acetyltransferase [Neisseria meningitidis]